MIMTDEKQTKQILGLSAHNALQMSRNEHINHARSNGTMVLSLFYHLPSVCSHSIELLSSLDVIVLDGERSLAGIRIGHELLQLPHVQGVVRS